MVRFRWRRTIGAVVFAGLYPAVAAPAAAADSTHPIQLLASHAQPRSGADLYAVACANCHGIDGRGAPQAIVEFPEALPDFRDCAFATREPDADWLAVTHDGGPARAFARMMPAFGGAMSGDELARVLAHMRTFCGDPGWPRGELNLPRPLVTEKAFPEDEAVITTAISTGAGDIANKFVYERRLGARNQIEVVVPFTFREGPSGTGTGWGAGIGDVTVGMKRAVAHSLPRGSIFSAAAELILPLGDESLGLSKRTPVFEPFVAFGQVLPRDGFVQAQAGVELPFDSDKGPREAFWRVALGRSFTEGRFGRTWSPMVELVAARELESGHAADWDLVPQMQVTLSTRQHIMASGGVRVPLNAREGRHTQIVFYLLWDWFDGPLFGGW
jgi:hypothetical protein